MTTPVIWLACLPCTGSMAARFLIANLLSDRIERSTDLWEWIPPTPRYNENTIRKINADGQTLCKTHFEASAFLFNDQRFRTEGFIYLIRHPFDMIASMVNLCLQRHPGIDRMDATSIAQCRTEYTEQLCRFSTIPEWLFAGFGTAESHIYSWLGINAPYDNPCLHHNPPHMVVRFEDLKSATEKTLHEISHFLKIDTTKARIEYAKQRASFEETQKIEETEIKEKIAGEFYDESYQDGLKAGFRIHHRGKSGYGTHQLTDKQKQNIWRWAEPWAERFGYSLDAA